jgi:DNA repair exonuclease SbcCD ATPase subunit
MSSDTPLTDWQFKCAGKVPADFLNHARTLERRVSQLEAELQSAEQVIEKSAGQPGSYLYTQRLEKRVTQLEAQLAEARKDSERLDWLDEKKADLCELNGWRAYDLTQEAGKIQSVRSHPTTRAAIDAAMKP